MLPMAGKRCLAIALQLQVRSNDENENTNNYDDNSNYNNNNDRRQMLPCNCFPPVAALTGPGHELSKPTKSRKNSAITPK